MRTQIAGCLVKLVIQLKLRLLAQSSSNSSSRNCNFHQTVLPIDAPQQEKFTTFYVTTSQTVAYPTPNRAQPHRPPKSRVNLCTSRPNPPTHPSLEERARALLNKCKNSNWRLTAHSLCVKHRETREPARGFNNEKIFFSMKTSLLSYDCLDLLIT